MHGAEGGLLHAARSLLLFMEALSRVDGGQILCKGLFCSESCHRFAPKSQSAHRAQVTLREGLRGALCLREGRAPLRQDCRGEKGTLWCGRGKEGLGEAPTRVDSSWCPQGQGRDPRAFPTLCQATCGGSQVQPLPGAEMLWYPLVTPHPDGAVLPWALPAPWGERRAVRAPATLQAAQSNPAAHLPQDPVFPTGKWG